MGVWDAQVPQFDSVLHLLELFSANLYGQVRLDCYNVVVLLLMLQG